jgi:hypothetical protein
MFMHQFEPVRPDQHADSWKDLWNNAIGRQIGEYVRKNNLSQNDLESLIAQAYDRGELITETNDPRIPRNASGWPGRFPRQDTAGAPIWAGPSSDWKPMPGPGIAKMKLQPPDIAR